MTNSNSTISIKTIDERTVAMDKMNELAKQIHQIAKQNQIQVCMYIGGVVRDAEGDPTKYQIELHQIDGSSVKKILEVEAARGTPSFHLETIESFQRELTQRLALASEFTKLSSNQALPSNLLHFLLRDEVRGFNTALETGEAMWYLANAELEKYNAMVRNNPKIAERLEKMKESGPFDKMFQYLKIADLETHLAIGLIAAADQFGERVSRASHMAREQMEQHYTDRDTDRDSDHNVDAGRFTA